MKNEFFNQYEFKRAVDVINSNPIEAIARFKNYVSKYPEDYSALPYYASTLIKLGYDEEAELILEKVDSILNDEFNNYDKKDYLRSNYLYTKLKLLSYQEKYKELYKLYVDNIDSLDKFDLDRLLFYTRNKLGLLKGENRNSHYYFFRQIIDYSESDFLDKVTLHTYDYNEKNVNNTNCGIFDKGFPLEEVIGEVKKHLLSSPSIYNGFVEDTYVFRYDYCGKVDNKFQNYFKVFCFHNTKNIITLYPFSECENLPYTDLNYMNVSNLNIKKKSRIDKFNDRYKNRS